MATPSREEYLNSVETAAENVLTQGGEAQAVDVDARARAATANVSGVQFIDYAEAIANYEARGDVEDFAQRRAREAATTFAATDFARSDTYDGGYGADDTTP